MVEEEDRLPGKNDSNAHASHEQWWNCGTDSEDSGYISRGVGRSRPVCSQARPPRSLALFVCATVAILTHEMGLSLLLSFRWNNVASRGHCIKAGLRLKFLSDV